MQHNSLEEYLSETIGIDFGRVIIALKNGKCVSRAAWNRGQLFVFMEKPSDVDGKIVPTINSLPQSAKIIFHARSLDPDKKLPKEWQSDDIRYRNQFVIVYPDNTISGWHPSVEDILAQDWAIKP